MVLAMTAFRHLGNRLALVEPQRPEHQPGVPQVDFGHGGRSPGKGPGGAVLRSQHLGGAGRGQEQGLALGVPEPGKERPMRVRVGGIFSETWKLR